VTSTRGEPPSPGWIDLCLESVYFGHQVHHDVPCRVDGRTRLARFERIVGSKGNVTEPTQVIEPSVQLFTQEGRTTTISSTT
jgi:hypothetical protein